MFYSKWKSSRSQSVWATSSCGASLKILHSTKGLTTTTASKYTPEPNSFCSSFHSRVHIYIQTPKISTSKCIKIEIFFISIKIQSKHITPLQDAEFQALNYKCPVGNIAGGTNVHSLKKNH